MILNAWIFSLWWNGFDTRQSGSAAKSSLPSSSNLRRLWLCLPVTDVGLSQALQVDVALLAVIQIPLHLLDLHVLLDKLALNLLDALVVGNLTPS